MSDLAIRVFKLLLPHCSVFQPGNYGVNRAEKMVMKQNLDDLMTEFGRVRLDRHIDYLSPVENVASISVDSFH